MSLYTLALFAHLLGVLGLFIAMGLQWTMTLQIRRARTIAQVREWGSLAKGLRWLNPVTGVLIIGAGIYMFVTAWSMNTPWIVVSLAAMLLMMVFGMGIAGRRMKPIQQAARAAAPSAETIPAELQRRIHDPLLWIGTQLAASTALGIVLMMTVKPDLGVSLLVVGVAIALGLVAALLTQGSAQPQEIPAL